MTRLIFAAALSVLLAVGSASAQSTGGTSGNTAGGATGATTGPGNTNNTGGSTAGTGGQLDQGTTGGVPGQKTQPPNKCDPDEAAKDGAAANQNNASAGCVK